MAKMTKAQARKRLEEARAKILKVMMNDNAIVYLTVSDMKKMYDTCQYLGRSVAKLK